MTAATARDVRAQAGAELTPLAIPTGVDLRCRLEPRDSSSRLGTVTRTYEFQLGKELDNERMLKAMFDTAGRPLVLVEVAWLRRNDGQLDMHTFLGGFPDSGDVTGFHTVYRPDDGAVGGAAAKPSAPAGSSGVVVEKPPLTDGEKRKIRVLMDWLWRHRCGERPK